LQALGCAVHWTYLTSHAALQVQAHGSQFCNTPRTTLKPYSRHRGISGDQSIVNLKSNTVAGSV
ncbi:hypothetical protein BG005_011091, partial [Podila minutissima]